MLKAPTSYGSLIVEVVDWPTWCKLGICPGSPGILAYCRTTEKNSFIRGCLWSNHYFMGWDLGMNFMAHFYLFGGFKSCFPIPKVDFQIVLYELKQPTTFVSRLFPQLCVRCSTLVSFGTWLNPQLLCQEASTFFCAVSWFILSIDPNPPFQFRPT